MISKKEMLLKMKEIEIRNLGDYKKALTEIAVFVCSLPDDTPDLLPFEYPVKEGYEVVTREGWKVEKLHEFPGNGFAGIINGFEGVYTWREDGRDSGQDIREFDLFLRPRERKVWVVEDANENSLMAMYSYQRSHIDKWLESNPGAKLYEATLKLINQQS